MSSQAARIVVGVDLAAGRGVTALVSLRLTRGRSSTAALALRSLSYPSDDDAIVATIAAATAEAQAAGVAPVVVGLDAPLTLPAQVAAALRGSSAPLGASPYPSPYQRAAERDPVWSQLGVRPFPVSFLGGLTFRAIPLAARLRAQSAEVVQIIEVFPSAAFVALGLLPAAPRRQPRQPKISPERRRLTQTALAEIISDLPGEPDDPLDADALDALAAALTAAAARLGATRAIGDPAEGCITLPTHPASDLFARCIPRDSQQS